MIRKECNDFVCDKEIFNDCEEKERFDCVGNSGYCRCGCDCCANQVLVGDSWYCKHGKEYEDSVTDSEHEKDLLGVVYGLKCDVCQKDVTGEDSNVHCSVFGAISFRYCKDCDSKMLEPYWAMVSYIANAGRFPDDINNSYQKIVRNILKGLGKSEEEFISDVNKEIDFYENPHPNDEPYDVDNDTGFDPYLGCFTDDC